MARMNFGPVLSFVALVGAILVFAYAMKNPNFKNMLSGIFQKITGKVGGGGTAPSPAPAPQQPAPAPQQSSGGGGGAGPITPTDPTPYSSRAGPGTRSQDPVTQAINRCVGVGVNPPDPQAYNDCVNAAYPKANRARIGIA